MKLIWCKRRRTWVEPAVVDRPRVYLQSDLAEPVASPVTGELLHSRGTYYAHLKEHGYHVSEAGDVAKRPAPDRRAIEQAVRRASEELGI